MGIPMVPPPKVFHGTAPVNGCFNAQKCLTAWTGIDRFSGAIQYFTEDFAYAVEFAKGRAIVNGMQGLGATVIVANVAIKAPFDATKKLGYWKKLQKDPLGEREKLQALGFDGICMYEGIRPVKTWVTFAPEQIKILEMLNSDGATFEFNV